MYIICYNLHNKYIHNIKAVRSMRTSWYHAKHSIWHIKCSEAIKKKSTKRSTLSFSTQTCTDIKGIVWVFWSEHCYPVNSETSLGQLEEGQPKKLLSDSRWKSKNSAQQAVVEICLAAGTVYSSILLCFLLVLCVASLHRGTADGHVLQVIHWQDISISCTLLSKDPN